MDNNKINIGDTVMVNFNNVKMTLVRRAEVLHIPCATGDSWVFKENEVLYYVSEPCTIVKMMPEQDDPEDDLEERYNYLDFLYGGNSD